MNTALIKGDITTVQQFEKIEAIEKILFVCFDEENYRIYQKLLSHERETE